MALQISESGEITFKQGPSLVVTGAGIVSLEYSTIKVNQRDLVQELSAKLENTFDFETDYSGNFAGRITLTLELLGDWRNKEA